MLTVEHGDLVYAISVHSGACDEAKVSDNWLFQVHIGVCVCVCVCVLLGYSCCSSVG